MQIGVTGHQRLDDTRAWAWVESAMCQELDALPQPLTAVSSLAIGADQLLASLVIRRGGQIVALIPFAGYERTFAPDDLEAYRQLLGVAVRVEVLESLGTDEDAYLAAGKRVVDLADRMLAVWNGQPAKGKGGTADIVAYALAQGVPLVHLNPATRTVLVR